MSKPIINKEDCIGCGVCVEACPCNVLVVKNGVAFVNNEDSCIGCGICEGDCPTGAIPEIES